MKTKNIKDKTFIGKNIRGSYLKGKNFDCCTFINCIFIDNKKHRSVWLNNNNLVNCLFKGKPNLHTTKLIIRQVYKDYYQLEKKETI